MSQLSVKVGLNDAGFKTGLAKLKATALGFKSSLGGMFSGFAGNMLSMLGLGGGVAGLTMLARKSIEAGSQISDLATQLRIGTTELQTLSMVAKDAGVETSKLEMTLRNLNQRTIDACDGNESYKDAFARLGIELKDFAGLPVDKKMEVIANAYKKSGESLTALNDISTIFGTKTGSAMLEVLDKLSTEGMPALTQSAIEAGQVMDEETIASLDRAGDEIGRWQNKIIVWFGTFLADMGSEVGRWKIGLQILQVFAEAVAFVENLLRDFGNYTMGFFASIGRYIGATFSDFIIPVRNLFLGLFETVGSALAKFIGLFNDSWANAVDNAVVGLKRIKEESNALNKADKGKSFGDIFSEEMSNAQSKNQSRKKSDLLSSYATDFYDKELEQVNKVREEEKKLATEQEKARKAKYAKADSQFEIKETAKDKQSKSKSKKEINYNDSYLARIGGGGLTAQRFDVPEKQLSEAKKQSDLLKTIAENTESSQTNSTLLMK